MTSLKTRLLDSLKTLILDELPDGQQHAADLKTKTPTELLRLWLNWVSRLPPPAPRQVLQSREFQAHTLRASRQADIDALIADITQGADLKKYLSKRVDVVYQDPASSKLHQREDLDLLLNAWGVHHLHFSQEMEPKRVFAKRGGPLIFAVFRPDKAYLIDIMSHDDWTRRHVIRVIVANWPNEELVVRLPGAPRAAPSLTDDEHSVLRKKSVNAPIEVDGKLYMAAAGMVIGGMTIETIRQADMIITGLEGFAADYERDPQLIINQIPAGAAIWPDEPEFVVWLDRDGYGVHERKSRKMLKLRLPHS